MPDLFQLLDTVGSASDRVHRNLWVIQLLNWIQGYGRIPAQAAGKVDLLLDALHTRTDRMEKLQRLRAATVTLWKQGTELTDRLASYKTGLEASGVSVNLVFRLRRLWESVVRIRLRLDCTLDDPSHTRITRVLVLVQLLHFAVAAKLKEVAGPQGGLILSTKCSTWGARKLSLWRVTWR